MRNFFETGDRFEKANFLIFFLASMFLKVSEELVRFLEYVGADLEASTGNFEDGFVSRLQESVRHVKASRKMEERYMLFEELLRNERKEGKAEGKVDAIIELLEDLGSIPEALKTQLEGEMDLNTLSTWLKMAAKAESIDQFAKEIQISQ